MPTNSYELRQVLIALLEDAPALDRPRVRSFQGAGIRNGREGLVIRFDNGAQFQLTIECTHPAQCDECGEDLNDDGTCPACYARDVEKLNQ